MVATCYDERPGETRIVAGEEVVEAHRGPHHMAAVGTRPSSAELFWLADGGGIGVERLTEKIDGEDGWGVIYRPHPDRERGEPFDVMAELTRYIQRPLHRTEEAAVRTAAELVARLREITAPDSGLQVMAGDWKGWPRGNPTTGWR